MVVFTLWLLLFLEDGSTSVVKSREFTTDAQCRKVVAVLMQKKIQGVKYFRPVCKKRIDV